MEVMKYLIEEVHNKEAVYKLKEDDVDAEEVTEEALIGRRRSQPSNDVTEGTTAINGDESSTENSAAGTERGNQVVQEADDSHDEDNSKRSVYLDQSEGEVFLSLLLISQLLLFFYCSVLLER